MINWCACGLGLMPGLWQGAAHAPSVSWNGYADVYFQHVTGGAPTGPVVDGREFDIDNGLLRLSGATLDASLPSSKAMPIGFTASLIAGEEATIMHSTEPAGPARYRNVDQAFLTWASAGKQPVTLNAGIGNTFVGYESLDARSDDQYSRSLLWTYAEPTYQLGVWGSFAASATTSVSLYAFNGWNEIQDSNGEKSFGASVTVTPNSRFSSTFDGYSGLEGSNSANASGSFGGVGYPSAGAARTNLGDWYATYQASAALKLAANADYGSAAGKGNWSGVAVYGTLSVGSKDSACARLEVFNDSSGLRTGIRQELREVTLSWNHNVCKNLLVQGELRRDFSNQAFFVTNAAPSRARTTLTLAAIVKF